MMHRTQSLDYGILIEGDMAMALVSHLLGPKFQACDGRPGEAVANYQGLHRSG